jgi:hypothetical protein
MMGGIGQESGIVAASSGIIQKILGFFYYFAHQIGIGFMNGFHKLFPNVIVPADLGDAVGFMVMITIFYFLVTLIKKSGSIIITIGWILIVVKIMLAFCHLKIKSGLKRPDKVKTSIRKGGLNYGQTTPRVFP